MFSGAEARALGVVTRRGRRSAAAARELARRSPSGRRTPSAAAKRCTTGLDRAADETLALEAELQRGLIGSPNQLAAVSAGFSKQPAEFVDP